MANYRKQETASRLKKAYSTLANAIKLSEIEQGIPSPQWDYYCDNCAGSFFEKNIAPYLSMASNGVSSNSPTYTGSKTFDGSLSDGVLIYLSNAAQYNIKIKFDINGIKGPNIDGRDQFSFIMSPQSYMNKYPKVKALDTYARAISTSDMSRETLKTNCRNDGRYCSELIMLDGWEIKDDYPLSI